MGSALKEGLLLSNERNDKILDLLLAASTRGDDLTSLAEYVDRIGEREGAAKDDKTIYFLTGADVGRAKASPVLEGFAKRGIEVLIFSDTVDELWLNQFGTTYGEYSFKNAAQADVDFGDQAAEPQAEVGELMAKIRVALQDQVKEVKASTRLTDSAVCLVTGAGDITPQMEKLLRASGQTVPEVKRVLEVNPNHPAVKALAGKPELVDEVAELLYGQALLAEGGTLDDPGRFGKLLGSLIERAAG
jgi:molecular chaperone HtpG